MFFAVEKPPSSQKECSSGCAAPTLCCKETNGGRWGEESKAIANQTSLGSGPKFGAARWTYSLQYHFLGRGAPHGVRMAILSYMWMSAKVVIPIHVANKTFFLDLRKSSDYAGF